MSPYLQTLTFSKKQLFQLLPRALRLWAFFFNYEYHPLRQLKKAYQAVVRALTAPEHHEMKINVPNRQNLITSFSKNQRQIE